MTYDFTGTTIRQLESYRLLGEKTFSQLRDEDLFWQFNDDSNSIAMIVKHMSGNMISRWTDFLTTDGEKDWRDRDSEFVNDLASRRGVLERWDAGWNCLLKALHQLTDDDLGRIVRIRGERHTVMEAINRQLAHYAYHIGQIVYIGKMLAAGGWRTLSIPKADAGHTDRKDLPAT